MKLLVKARTPITNRYIDLTPIKNRHIPCTPLKSRSMLFWSRTALTSARVVLPCKSTQFTDLDRALWVGISISAAQAG